MKARILIVDNMPAFIVPIKEFLERNGYEVASATNVPEALAAATNIRPNVAILDLRLVDNASEFDFSGLDLARRLDPHLPKIMLTGFPTIQVVREALGHSPGDLPLAVAFLTKNEPMEMLLRAVQLALIPPDNQLLHYMGAPAMHALPERIASLGSTAAAARLGEFISAQDTQFSRELDREIKEAAGYYRLSLVFSALSFMVLLVAIGFSLAGKVSIGLVSTAGSLVIHLLGAVVNRRADHTHQRIEAALKETKDLITFRNLLDLCACFSDVKQQDLNRQAIFDAFLERLVHAGNKKKKARSAGE